ncbi:MAG: AAA family ATPase [Candidatus Acidiferrum sp.]
MNRDPHKEKHTRLALVGMSGSGKTFWSRKLAASGWTAVSCDDLIEKRLAPRLAAGGYSGINGVAAWMGWPDSPTYAEREAEYLAEEISVVDEFLTVLEKENASAPIVLDTTGSVIYAQNNILMRLRRQMTVIHLASTDSEQQLLVQRYLHDPKPVLWRGTFHVKDHEFPRETVARCYPQLIALRKKSYETLAHHSVQVAALRSLGAGNADSPDVVEKFLKKIQAQEHQ